MSSYQYGDSHVKDKTVSPTTLSLTWESPYLGKMVFILRQGPGFSLCWYLEYPIFGVIFSTLLTLDALQIPFPGEMQGASSLKVLPDFLRYHWDCSNLTDLIRSLKVKRYHHWLRNQEDYIYNLLVSSVSADCLAPQGAKTSAGTMLTSSPIYSILTIYKADTWRVKAEICFALQGWEFSGFFQFFSGHENHKSKPIMQNLQILNTNIVKIVLGW